MKDALERALFRTCIRLVWALVFLTAWNTWPTDGTPAPVVDGGPHFHLRY